MITKLTNLDPRWLTDGNRRIGIMFKCPEGDGTRGYQTCFFYECCYKEQREAVWRAAADLADENKYFGDWQPCGPFAWSLGDVRIEDANFETLTVTPSIDGSRAGNWHGHITNGACVP